MQKLAEGLKPTEIIEIIIRRRWYIIISFCFSMIAGIYLAFTLPKIYSAQTLILVQPQKVPDDYVQSVVSTDFDSRIRTIAQQIMSRTNLEKIIKDFGLFKGPGHQNMYMEDKIGSLQKRISVDLIRRNQRSGADAFSISFKGGDPENVMKITNALTSYIIDENLRVRENLAIGTSDFLDEELNSIRKELVAQEEKLKEYREKYMGGLPEQLESNLRLIDRLQLQLSSQQVSLRDAKNRLAMLKNQISEGQRTQNQGARITADGQIVFDSGESLSPDQARARLAYLETRYTEKHPDVIQLKEIISDFEKKNEKDAQGSSEELQYVSADVRRQLQEIKAEIRAHNADISQLAKQIRVYQKRVESTPKREQQYLSIKRDYDNIKATYDSLLNRKLEAKISVNMEKKQKGEQFRIIDSARLPHRPISPDMPRYSLLCLPQALESGAGLFFSWNISTHLSGALKILSLIWDFPCLRLFR